MAFSISSAAVSEGTADLKIFVDSFQAQFDKNRTLTPSEEKILNDLSQRVSNLAEQIPRNIRTAHIFEERKDPLYGQILELGLKLGAIKQSLTRRNQNSVPQHQTTQPIKFESSGWITIPGPVDDVLAKAIALSANQPNCFLVSKTWNVVTLTSYQYLLDDYKLDARIRPFVPTDTLPTGNNGFLQAVQQTFRAVTKSTHAPHIQREIKKLDRSKPLVLGPVLKIVEDANLVQLFTKISEKIPYNELTTLKIEFAPGWPIRGDIASNAAMIRNWMENHQGSLDRITMLSTFRGGRTLPLKLTTLSPEIWKLTNLQTLSLAENQLVALPQEVSRLTSLVVLDLDFNDLTTLPPQIGQLPNLQCIALVGNKRLAALPKEICQLKKLGSLSLPNFDLSNIVQEYNMEGRKRLYGTITLQVENLTNLCAFSKIIGAFYEKETGKALGMFKELPTDTKNGIYEELRKIIFPELKNDHYGCGEDAFLERNGQNTSNSNRVRAIKNFANVSEMR